MRIAILTTPGAGSPLILAHSLKSQLEESGHTAEISTEINVLNRLVSFKNNTLGFHFWLWEKTANYFLDRRLIKCLKKAEAVVVCDCIPNGFWRGLYNIEKLKKITKKPVLFYEVFYLGNAPTQIERLQINNDPLRERYDAHLFVSPVTEIRAAKPSNAYCIGIGSKSWNLAPLPKKELVAVVDFAQSGYEKYREIQIKQLQKAGIAFISLEKNYSVNEIRNLYRQASIFFVQFPEAFGLPILECLCSGAQIFTPDSGWPMSWRLDESPEVHGPGILPGCFTVYRGTEDLSKKLLEFKASFNPVITPEKVFRIFYNNYPTFYDGNAQQLRKCLHFLKEGSFAE